MGVNCQNSSYLSKGLPRFPIRGFGPHCLYDEQSENKSNLCQGAMRIAKASVKTQLLWKTSVLFLVNIPV